MPEGLNGVTGALVFDTAKLAYQQPSSTTSHSTRNRSDKEYYATLLRTNATPIAFTPVCFLDLIRSYLGVFLEQLCLYSTTNDFMSTYSGTASIA